MNRSLWHKLEWLVVLIVGGYFLYAGAAKIHDPTTFAKQIGYYKIMPLWTINAQALLMPWWEVVAAAAMITPWFRRPGAWLVFGMLLIFTAAIASAVARGLDISCGCTAASSAKVGFPKLIENIAMIIAVAAVIWYRPPAPAAVTAEPAASLQG
jgi:uncharacterized membrane protein YphA (DoxX/SURF4 family)